MGAVFLLLLLTADDAEGLPPLADAARLPSAPELWFMLQDNARFEHWLTKREWVCGKQPETDAARIENRRIQMWVMAASQAADKAADPDCRRAYLAKIRLQMGDVAYAWGWWPKLGHPYWRLPR